MGRGSGSQGRTDKAESRSSDWEDPRGAHSDSCAGNTAGSDDGHGPVWELGGGWGGIFQEEKQ